MGKSGVVYFVLSLLLSVAAQLILKAAMLELGSFTETDDWLRYLQIMIDLKIITGLLIYGLGTIFWILCLGKMDLGLAYPLGTLQYILIFVGAWWLFDEQISPFRLLGMLTICLGILIMSFEFRKS